MGRVWVFVAIILLIGVLLGIWLATRARQREAGSASRSASSRSGASRPTGPDDDAQFLRSINIDPDTVADEPEHPEPDKPEGDKPKGDK